MKRSDFIKSIALILVAPKVVAQTISQEPKLNPVKRYKFKITGEMRADIRYIDYLFENKNSWLRHDCELAEIDFDKPFEVNFGYERGDFVRNSVTVIISQ